VRKLGCEPGQAPLFIAFSAGTPRAREYLQLLDTGIDELRANGELSVMLRRYGLGDWEAP
jgi:ABC-type amino acid transport substrate-binding protein